MLTYDLFFCIMLMPVQACDTASASFPVTQPQPTPQARLYSSGATVRKFIYIMMLRELSAENTVGRVFATWRGGHIRPGYRQSPVASLDAVGAFTPICEIHRRAKSLTAQPEFCASTKFLTPSKLLTPSELPTPACHN
jgi:hypothetical protein